MHKALSCIRIIDTHVHVWRSNAPWMSWLGNRPDNWDCVRRDFTLDDLTGVLDAAGVSDLILVQAGMTTAETYEMLELAREEPRILGVVGWASLQSVRAVEEAFASFEERGAEKLVGIRNNHRWAPDGDVIALPEARDACRLIARRGLAVDLHFGDYSELPIAFALVDAIPEARFVIDHLGKPLIKEPEAFDPWADAMATLSRAPNVFVKYSGWATFAGRARADDIRRYTERVLELFGPERLMYGSNWPVALVADNYQTTLEATLDAAGSADERALASIFRETALRCYLPGAYDRNEADGASTEELDKG
jgi:L-fuconolactonase